MSRIKLTPPIQRQYLIAVTSRSTAQVWITAFDQATAVRRAKQLWRNDEGAFVGKGGGIESVDVLSARSAEDA